MNIFNIISNILAIVTYSQYFKQTVEKSSKPNPATWLIWVIISLLNSYTYSILSSSIIQSSFLWFITAFTFIIFIYSLINGRFSKLSIIETLSLIFTFLLLMFYFYTKKTIITHLSLQVVYVISYVPTIIGIIHETNHEKQTAWILAFLTYLFALFNLFYIKESNWIKYLHIIINGLIGNGLIIILSNKYKSNGYVQ